MSETNPTSIERTEAHDTDLRALQTKTLNAITDFSDTEEDRNYLTEALKPFEKMHPDDFAETVAATWKTAEKTKASPLVLDAITSAVLALAKNEPQDIGQTLPFPSYQLQKLQLMAIAQANEDRIPMSNALHKLSTEALALAFPALADFSPDLALAGAKMLLHGLPKSSPHRAEIIKIRAQAVESKEDLATLFKDSLTHKTRDPSLHSVIKCSIIKKFNTLSKQEQIDMVVGAVHDEVLMGDLKDTIAPAKIKNTLKSARPDTILSLVFDARIRDHMLKTMSLEEKHKAVWSLNLDNFV